MAGYSGEGVMSLPTLYSSEGISSRHGRHSDDGRCFDLKTAFYNTRFFRKVFPALLGPYLLTLL